MPFHVTEPHPSVPKHKSSYIHAGRGGAGNYAKYSHSDLTSGPTATGPASILRKLPSPPNTSTFTSGRGGAGNAYRHRSESPRRIFSFDEELAREAKIMENAAKTPIYHIGRGGAGNAFNEVREQERSERRASRISTASDLSRVNSHESGASSGSSGSVQGKRNGSLAGTLSRIGRTLSRN